MLQESFSDGGNVQENLEHVTDCLRDNSRYDRISMIDIKRDSNDISEPRLPFSVIIDGKVFKGPFRRIR